jgi:hypothetical protein
MDKGEIGASEKDARSLWCKRPLRSATFQTDKENDIPSARRPLQMWARCVLLRGDCKG